MLNLHSEGEKKRFCIFYNELPLSRSLGILFRQSGYRPLPLQAGFNMNNGSEQTMLAIFLKLKESKLT